MPISAKFVADFQGFLAAVDKAEIALVDFGKGAGKVESSLNRMTDSFSGRKLIQEASLMTIAIEKAGGTSVLTAKELEAVGNKANEAAEKMKKLGYDVPAGLQKLANETKAATGHLDGMRETVTKLAIGFGAMFTARAALNFVGDVLKNASALKDLSTQTQINVEELQLMGGAMSEFGVDADSLGKGLYGLSRRIAKGDDSVSTALASMGLSLKDVQGLNGEALFMAIERGLATLQGSLRDEASATLFGSRLGMAMGGAAEGIDEAMQKARALNKVVSTESINAMDEYSEAIERAQRNLTAMAGNAIGPVAQGFNVLNDAAAKGASKWEIFKAMFVDFTNSGLRVGASTSALAKLLDDLNKKTETGHVATAAFVGPLNQVAKAHDDGATKAKAHAKATDTVAESMAKFTAAVKGLSFKTYIEDTSRLNAVIPNLSAHMAEMSERFEDVREHMDDLESSDLLPFLANKLPGAVAQATREIEKAGEKIKASFGERTYNALGDVDRILSNIPGKFAEIGAMVARTGQAIMKNLADGNVWGAVIAGVTGAISVFTKLFNSAEKQVNPVREAFVRAAGGLAELDARAHDAGVTLTALLNAKNPEAYKKAIDDLNAAFKFQDDAMKTLDDTAAKYGLTLAEMGPKYRQGKLDEQFLTLLQDQKVLAAGGVELDLVLQKQAESFQGVIDKATESGSTIPASLKPTIERMIELGLLTDESGEKFTDIGKLTFAETLDSKFTTLIATIEKLAAAISGKLGNAISNIPTKVNVDVDLNAHWNIPDMPRDNFAATGGLVTANGIQYLAGGGNVLPFRSRGSDTVPAMLTPGEGVVSRRGMAALGRSGLSALNSGAGLGGADLSTLQDEVAGLRSDLAADRRVLGKQIRDAINLAS
jgi:hypothetical protein